MTDEPKACALHGALGSYEECAGAWCPFWQRGGAVAEAACEIERLGLDLETPGLAAHLADLRRTLERARDETEAAKALRDLAKLVPPDLLDSY